MCAMNSETAPDGVIETRGWVTRYDWVVETKHFLNQRLPVPGRAGGRLTRLDLLMGLAWTSSPTDYNVLCIIVRSTISNKRPGEPHLMTI